MFCYSRSHYDTNGQIKRMLWTQLVCMFVFPLALYGLNGPAQAQAAAIGGGIALLPGALQFALLSLSKNVSALTFLMHLYAGEALKVLIVGSAFWATFHFYNLNKILNY